MNTFYAYNLQFVRFPAVNPNVWIRRETILLETFHFDDLPLSFCYRSIESMNEYVIYFFDFCYQINNYLPTRCDYYCCSAGFAHTHTLHSIHHFIKSPEVTIDNVERMDKNNAWISMATKSISILWCSSTCR